MGEILTILGLQMTMKNIFEIPPSMHGEISKKKKNHRKENFFKKL
jgi:hypothetical protein